MPPLQFCKLRIEEFTRMVPSIIGRSVTDEKTITDVVHLDEFSLYSLNCIFTFCDGTSAHGGYRHVSGDRTLFVYLDGEKTFIAI